MIIDVITKKINAFEETITNKFEEHDKTVTDISEGLLMVADSVDELQYTLETKLKEAKKEIGLLSKSVKMVKEIKGEDGIDGLDGANGKDGSPDTGNDIADKLNKLEEVIEPKVIKGLGEYVNKTDLNRTISTLENQTRFLIQSNTNRSGGSSVWGGITGTLSAQTDLQAALDSKLSTSASDVAITVRAATTAALAGTWTYNNGTAGVGATLTRTTNGALPAQDGVTLIANDRILIKNQVSTLVNGIYVVTQVGVTSVSPTILTRATDADSTAELDELVVTASEGTTNRSLLYGQQTNNPTVGTSAIVFATVVSTAVTQATSGTQVINQIPLLTGTARQITRGTSAFTFNPTTNALTVGGIATFTSGGVSTLSTDIPQTVKVSVSSANILALNSTPKQLIAAPGAGKYIKLLGADFSLTYGTTDYSYGISPADVTLTYGTTQCSGRITLNASATLLNTIALSDTYDILTNTAVNFYCSTGNPTLGDSTVNIYLTYRIVTL